MQNGFRWPVIPLSLHIIINTWIIGLFIVTCAGQIHPVGEAFFPEQIKLMLQMVEDEVNHPKAQSTRRDRYL